MATANIDQTSELMQPTWETHTKIKQASWLTDPSTEYLIATCRKSNIEVMFVGGCVRNTLLAIDSDDIDMATTATPDELVAVFEEAYIKYDTRYKKYGLIIVTIDHRVFEITTLRSEIYYSGNKSRYPDKITFIDNWLEDAHRRDFTCNAIYCDIDGNLYDPFGGIEDLKESKLRFIGNAGDRIEEDPLRIMRFFRFYTIFNIKNMSYFTEKIIKDKAELLSNISNKMLFREMKDILSKPNIIGVISVMDKTRVLEQVLGISNPDIILLREIMWLEKRASVLSGILPNPIRRLNALVSFDYELAQNLIMRLDLNSYDLATMLFLSEVFNKYTIDDYDDIFQHLGDTLNLSRMRHLVIIAWAFDRLYADNINRKTTSYWLNILTKLAYDRNDTMPIIENKILSIGFSKGHVVGKVVKKLELERCKTIYNKDTERLSNYIEKYT